MKNFLEGYLAVGLAMFTTVVMRRLQEMGCDFAQGYLYSRPLPLNEFENLLVDWPNQDEPETEQNTA